MAVDYHDRPEWSYSQMKVILESGIDYAVAAKRKMIPGPASRFIDLGECVHMLLLGGKDNFVLQEDSGFADFRTKASREWKKAQEDAGKTIITRAMWEALVQITANIEAHPHAEKYLIGDGFQHEVEMFARADGVPLRGKADAIKTDGDSLIETDIKTTAQFDGWIYKAQRRHYDLQAANYTLIGSASQKIPATRTTYYFCLVETVLPYRVQFIHATTEFVEAGERKLRKCLDEIKAFGDREPTFLLTDIPELGDYSL